MVKKRSAGRGEASRVDEMLLPDLGTIWLEAGRAGSTIVFDHFDLHMIGRAGEGDYTSSRTYVAEAAYMLTLEFDEERFQELLRLLPKAGAAQISRALGGPFGAPQIINIPPGAVVVGVRGRLGNPRTNGEESYVPIIVSSLFKPGPIMSVTFEEERPEGVLEVLQGPSGLTHGCAGEAIGDGDLIDVWLKQENNWVSGRYQATQTTAGAFETKFAMLQTERTGGRPIFLGYRVRRASQR
jgi:hypothetical protein